MKKLTETAVFKDFREKSGVLFQRADKRKIRIVLLSLGVFTASLLLGGVEFPNGNYPFGIAIILASNGVTYTGLAFAGAMLSTLSMNEYALIYIVAISFVFAARICANALSGAIADTNNIKRKFLRESSAIRIAICGATFVAMGIYSAIVGESLYYSIYSGLLGVTVSCAVCGGYLMLFSKSAKTQTKLSGFCVLCFSIISALKTLGLPFNIEAVAGCIITFYCAYSCGCGVGCAVGICCGVAAGFGFSTSLGLMGFLCGMLFSFGENTAVIVSGICGVLYLCASEGFYAVTEYMPEMIFAGALTIPLLKFKILSKDMLNGFLNRNPQDFVLAEKEYVSDAVRTKCRNIGETLDSLSGYLIKAGEKMRRPTEQEAYRICTQTRTKHCVGCKYENICMGSEEREVSSLFSNMAHSLTLRGKVSASLVPERIAKRCYKMDSILESINTTTRKVTSLTGVDSRELLASDYAALAELLKETSELSGDFEKDEAAETKLKEELSFCGFNFSSLSVYGKRIRKIYFHGIDCNISKAGEGDIRECVESFMGCAFSPIDFSIEEKTVCASMVSVPKFEIVMGKYSGTGERETVSGDTVSTFGNKDGYYYSLVSDGMGSGECAASASRITSLFLKELLSAGCPMKSALQMLNCFLRGSYDECFTTVDLMEVDTILGKARFIKSGAAPSFIMREGQIFRIHSKTVPVGIMRALDAESVSFDLKGGDTVIMMSDGVTGNYEDCAWLYELLGCDMIEEDSPARIARAVGEKAAEAVGAADDISVCVMKVMAL